MSAPGEGAPPEKDDPRARTLRLLGLAVAIPSVVLFLLVMIFVIRTELAHDPADCPFELIERRTLGDGLEVHDERRRCLEGTEEHRFLVVRPENGPRELGRRRLPRERYFQDAYRFTVELEDGYVRVHVENDGVEPADFRERREHGEGGGR